MKKNIIKNEKGVTLIILVITIIILAILASLAIRNMDTGTDIRNYNYMCADIELLESKIMTYYNKNGILPVKGEPFNATDNLAGQASTKDNENYYQIDTSLLENITLSYGGGTLSDKNIYIINEQSHEVYYLLGAKLEDTLYHTEK